MSGVLQPPIKPSADAAEHAIAQCDETANPGNKLAIEGDACDVHPVVTPEEHW